MTILMEFRVQLHDAVTCHDVALARLANRAIKETTLREYLASLRALDLADVPFDSVTVAMLTTKLQRVLSPNTRRKHAINLRACLGLPLPCPKPVRKDYEIPDLTELRAALENSSYRMWGFAMLFAGLRLGEACTNQPIKRHVITVDRQRLPDGTISTPKTAGPVTVPPWFADEYRHHDFARAANTVYVGIRRAGKRAGIPDLTPHRLRHAFATNLVNAGCSPEVLRRQMRHHDVSVSLRFYVRFV
ncbi:tyrosine-type recombinase/integrase [Blastococcus sp. HT6-30]|uniref:tyrosine-type recombinase/integrase n=1 Tax=Blastococcus sp. HT6-30 TaxID=3144843 RepID=UPI00321B90E8